jgi:NitT/TauT family transport system permease protein
MSMNKPLQSFGWSLLPGIAALVIWEWAAQAMHWSALVLPAPSVIASSLGRGLASGYLWPHLVQTTAELVWGLLLGCSAGFAGGLVLGESALLRGMLMPYVVTSQVIPKLALAPLFIVWFGFGTLPVVVITALICFFPLLENTLTGLQLASQQQLELFRMLGASRWQTVWRLKVPAGLPGMLAGLRVAVVLALVGAVVGEFVGASKGLGALIIAAQGSMDTPLMFAVLTLITALGLTLYQLTLSLERWLLKAHT